MERAIATSLAMLSLLTLAGCERWELDRKMEALCKKDGGVKVYATVTLPATYFDDLGRLKVSGAMPYGTGAEDSQFRRVGDDEYRIFSAKTYLVGKDADVIRGKGTLARRYVAVYRWRDKHLLGESVEYWRGGGDGFTFGFQPSSSVCPFPRVDIVQMVLLKGY